MDTAAAESIPHRPIYRFAIAVTIATLILLFLGAMVTSTGSGLAYEDWPLASGSVLPADMFEDLAKFFEHFHRLWASLVGLSVLVLVVWIQRVDRRRWLRRSAWGTFVLVVWQGLVGGIGVLKKLPYVTSITHGVLAQVIVCLLALIAFALSPAWLSRTAGPADSVARGRRLAWIGVALVLAQLLAGAILRHTNWPGLLWLHVGMALVVAFAIMIAAFYCGTRFEQAPGFARLGRYVLIVLVLQLGLGFVTLMVRRVKHPSNIEHLGRSALVSVHVVVGALLLLSIALLAYRAQRNLVASPGS